MVVGVVVAVVVRVRVGVGVLRQAAERLRRRWVGHGHLVDTHKLLAVHLTVGAEPHPRAFHSGFHAGLPRPGRIVPLGIGVLDEGHVVLASHAGVGGHEVHPEPATTASTTLRRAQERVALGRVTLRGQGGHVALTPGAGVEVGGAAAHHVREGAGLVTQLRRHRHGRPLQAAADEGQGRGRHADQLVEVKAVGKRGRDGQRPLLGGPVVGPGRAPRGGEAGRGGGEVQGGMGGEGGAGGVLRHPAPPAAHRGQAEVGLAARTDH